jgi:hypothetical protein
MAKTSGLGNAFWLDGVDLSGDINRLDPSLGGHGVWDDTAINQSAVSRLGTQRSGTIAVTSFFNPSAGAAHPTFDTLPRTDRIPTYLFGTSLGSAAEAMVAKQVTYNPSRGEDGSLLHSVECQSNGYGKEYVTLLTAGKRTDTAATNGSGVDNSASTAFGLQAYLHVFAFTGTSVTVKLQHSNDDASTDPYADVTGGAFTAATAIGAQRIATSNALTIKRWIRVVTTGTFSNAQFAVLYVRNNVAGQVF